MIQFAAVSKLIQPRGTINLDTSGKMVLWFAVSIAGVLIGYFVLSYFLEWRLKRDFRRQRGSSMPKSKGFFWYYIQDWKKRREFRRAWNRKRAKSRTDT